MFVVLKDVLALLELDGELVARVGVSGVTGGAQLLGLRVSWMTSGKGEGTEYYKNEQSGRASMHDRRG